MKIYSDSPKIGLSRILNLGETLSYLRSAPSNLHLESFMLNERKLSLIQKFA